MGDIERRIATFVCGLSVHDIPPQVRKLGQICFADTVGTVISGGQSLQQRIGASVTEEGGFRKRYVAGLGMTRMSLYDCVWLNASCAHAQEYNDLFYCQPGHPSAVLVPVAMALGMERAVRGEEMITAYIAGFEVIACVNQALLPKAHRMGFHTTSVAGIIGAAVCAGKLLELDHDQMQNAVALACSFASGLRESFGTMANSFHVGMAAASGLRAAQLAAHGAGGCRDILSGGFCRCFGGSEDQLERLSSGLGRQWAFIEPGVIIKDYPCCFSAYQAVEAALDIASRDGFVPERIESVYITTSENHYMSLPRKWPESLYGQRFCVPFCTASALVRGQLSSSCFYEGAQNERTLRSIGEKTTYAVDPEQRGMSGFGYSTVTVVMDDKTRFTKIARPGKRHRAEEHSTDALKKKFSDCYTACSAAGNPALLYDEIMEFLVSDKPTLYCEKERHI